MAGVAPSELAAIPLFASLSEAELVDVAGRLAVKELEPGVRLAGEGATGPALFVLQAGEASVTVGGEEVATLGPGDFLGEIALLGGGRRTATVTTTSAARVLVLFRDDVHELVASFPDVGARIEAAMQARLGRPPASAR